MIENAAFHSLSYGLYVIGAREGDKLAGCVANTFQQVTSSPLQVSVALNKENCTTGEILASGRFTASVLAETATMELIGRFGFHTSCDMDKFDGVAHELDASGVPYLTQDCAAWFSARVVQTLDLGTHMLFVGEVEAAEKLSPEPPMTYAYYHLVKGGKTPPKASSYLPGDDAPRTAEEEAVEASTPDSEFDGGGGRPKYAWQCTVCGHIEYVDELPEDFTCPICGVGRDMFERIAV